MSRSTSYSEAQKLIIGAVSPIDTENVPLFECAGRILAFDLVASENVPAFDRSPYDGYAFRAEDSAQASQEKPVTLRILEEIPAGSTAHCEISAGTAAKILTGAPIPPGADAVIPFEKTEFTAETVTLFGPVKKGANIVKTGEDIKKGTVMVKSGSYIDAGVMGSLAAQNISAPLVYRKPRVAVLSTGSELVELGTDAGPGKIHDSNGYTLSCVISRFGGIPVYYGLVRDNLPTISAAMAKALEECDAVITTGGVSVGDYDLTPAAMEQCGVEILFRGVSLKPGMACAYGIKGGKPVFGLSGNPASSVTNFLVVGLPAFRKLCGESKYEFEEVTLTLAEGFGKKSPSTRVLRGTLDISDGTAKIHIPESQGNVVISSMIGSDALAIIPAGSDPVPAGAQLKGFVFGR